MNLPEILVTGLQEGCGLSERKAREQAKKLIEWGAQNGQSGTEHYWPCQFQAMNRTERDAAIRKEYNGRNLKFICEKYRVTHMTVYRAIHS